MTMTMTLRARLGRVTVALFLVSVAGAGAAAPPPASKGLGDRVASKIDAARLIEDLRLLSADDMEGRATGTAGGERARAYVEKRFREAGLDAFEGSYVREFSFTPRGRTEPLSGANVVGFVRGTASPDRAIVVSAHYDHLGVRRGVVFNGADDNASGTAAIIAIAAHFKARPPKNTLVFVAFDAEEYGGDDGASQFLNEPPLPRERIALNVNVDMIGRDARNVLWAVGTKQHPFLKPILEPLGAANGIELRFGHDDPEDKKLDDWTNDSDHAAFHRRGIPFVYFGVEDEEHHHKPTDDFETITREFFVNATVTVLDAVRALDGRLEAIK